MWLTEKILEFSSLAVVGLAKNVGKTETLNLLLRELHSKGSLGVTSIGIDGETIDQVSNTRKPEITLFPGMFFSTAEAYYRRRRLLSEIIEIDGPASVAGRQVMAKAVMKGKAILAGPSDTASLKRLLEKMRSRGVDTMIVDGALSRLSPASPAVTKAMILATGAALSPDISRIVKKTAFVCRLISLPQTSERLRADLLEIENGVRFIDPETDEILDPQINSALALTQKIDCLREVSTVYVGGMVSDKFLQRLSDLRYLHETTLICRDFTKMFVEPQTLDTFLRRGGRIEVLMRSRLLAVTINPWSPAGYMVDGEKLRQRLSEVIDVPVENIFDRERQ